VYRHRDVTSLEERLRAVQARRKLIVTDSVFSMDGDTAPLEPICDLAERYGAMVMVDEAHATGVVGPRGAGLVEALGLEGRVTVQMGTLGKALGCFGAYVAGTETLIEYLINYARTFVYTTALPPPVVAAAVAALSIVEGEPQRRESLSRNGARLQAGLKDLGYEAPAEVAHILFGEFTIETLVGISVGVLLAQTVVSLIARFHSNESFQIPPVIEARTYLAATVVVVVAALASAFIRSISKPVRWPLSTNSIGGNVASVATLSTLESCAAALPGATAQAIAMLTQAAERTLCSLIIGGSSSPKWFAGLRQALRWNDSVCSRAEMAEHCPFAELQTIRSIRIMPLSFFHELRFQVHCADAVDFAGDVVTIDRIHQTDALYLGPTFDHQ